MEYDPERSCRTGHTCGRPYRIQQIVAEYDSQAEGETRAWTQVLHTSQHHHTGPDRPDNLQPNVRAITEAGNAQRREGDSSRNDGDFDENQPQAAKHQKP